MENGIELAVVLPTFNERENVIPVLSALSTALSGINYEVIFVDDDSNDGTHAAIRDIAQVDRKVRIVRRIKRRGLSSACVEGMMSTAAPYIAVMDADLQHDESILPEMLRRLKSDRLDIVIGSRNVDGGSMGDFTKNRVALSDLGKRLSRYACRCDIGDPMSGFFVLDRRFLEEVVHGLSAVGFKILVDLLSSARRPVKLAEIPYRFRSRHRGESKLDVLVGVEYIQLLLDKLVGDYIPPRFLLFGLVGAAGVTIYFSTLLLALHVLRVPFMVAQALATGASMTMNFFLNNAITYRDRRLKGSKMWKGLLSFYAACAVGLWLNVKFSDLLRGAGVRWYIAGVFGLGISWVWNFGATSILTWRTNRFGPSVRPARIAVLAPPIGSTRPVDDRPVQ